MHKVFIGAIQLLHLSLTLDHKCVVQVCVFNQTQIGKYSHLKSELEGALTCEQGFVFSHSPLTK